MRNVPITMAEYHIYSHFRDIFAYFGQNGCHGNAPLSLVYESVTDEFPDRTNPISKANSLLCMDVLHTTEVMAIFVISLPILAKIWFPWQRPLDPCNQKCLLWIGRPRKTPCYK